MRSWNSASRRARRGEKGLGMMSNAPDWKTHLRGNIRAPEEVRYMRVVETYQGYVRLEDGRLYLSDITPSPGEIVMAHLPWDEYGYITPA